ncbi:MAG TPA: UPF0182 family protein [Bryobacteraceae bacterium]|nr:UPF0182 family protein [Bryobacteraceae bacterium]
MITALQTSPGVPRPSELWRPLRMWGWIVYGGLLLAAIPDFLVDYWFFQSLGRAGIFWTNLKAQVMLFLIAGLLFALAVFIPLSLLAPATPRRRITIHLSLWTGIFAGWLSARHYLDYLLAFYGGVFGSRDPVFGHDIGWYVFRMPAVLTTVDFMIGLSLLGAIASLAGRVVELSTSSVFRESENWGRKASLLLTPVLNVALFVLGVALTGRTFLSRYDLLFKDNGDSGVRAGAEYLDVEGIFSSLNLIYVSVMVELALVGVIGYALYRAGKQLARSAGTFRLIGGLIAADFLFFLGVVVKDHIWVRPNEPTIQIPYIQRHMKATVAGYRLENIKTVEWKPPQDPVPVERMLASKTLRQAPLIPPWVSRLEEPPDAHHFQRTELSKSTFIYGPALQVFEQEQQLRPYYKFLSVDPVRYSVDGEKRMYASAVRELPSRAFVGPKEWLRYWGSAALMFTHGMGLVMSPVNEINEEGGPVYAVQDIPPRSSDSTFEAEPRIYFGEGAKDDYVLTNIRHLKELDYATPQFRQEFVYPADNQDGIPVNSLLKRFIFGIQTGDLTAFLFSSFIDPDTTRVHVYRTPLRRARRIAPFLFLDSNAFAFIADRRIQWMVNALTTSANYPYSFREVLGDKADERAVEKFPERIINYAEDSVKITVDAFSGDIHFYRTSEDPVVKTWERIYPGLFEPRTTMPQAVRAQLAYPLQWFHVQFDDIYKRYHQLDPIEFYNVEDLWDDADEVVGSIGLGLFEFGTQDQSTFSYEGHSLLVDSADLPEAARISPPGDLQYVMMMPFTPEGAKNLRSLVLAYQDPENYGTLMNLRIPQGALVFGPEQVDTIIDNDSEINQQITLWVRHGSEVIRGHTLLVPVAGDLVYVEPLWISSLQNPLPEIKLFSVVYRGRAAMWGTLPKALRLLEVPKRVEHQATELPRFR